MACIVTLAAQKKDRKAWSEISNILLSYKLQIYKIFLHLPENMEHDNQKTLEYVLIKLVMIYLLQFFLLLLFSNCY